MAKAINVPKSTVAIPAAPALQQSINNKHFICHINTFTRQQTNGTISTFLCANVPVLLALSLHHVAIQWAHKRSQYQTNSIGVRT